MLVLVGMSRMITRKLRTDKRPGRWQTGLESIVLAIQDQLKEIGLKHPRTYIGFIGSLFLFVAFAALCTIFPYYEPPTSSLSTTAALALAVFLAVPFFAISQRGWLEYVKTYLEPTPVMLPFNIISELSRTLAMAIRLFGNMMSGHLVVALIVALVGFLVPVPLMLLDLFIGLLQAYIFTILASVYIGAALRAHEGDST